MSATNSDVVKRCKIGKHYAVCPKHHVIGILKIKVANGKLYWYCHHWWQKDAANCYIGKVGKVGRYFDMLTARNPNFVLHGERIREIAEQLDGLENKEKIMVATELYIFDENNVR
jgi:hypothetical protein